MAITSSSTVDQIKAQYIDNCDWDVSASTSKAILFIKACRVLLLVMPKMASQDRASFSLSPEMIQEELQRAVAWYATYGSGGGTRHFSLENFRDAGSSACGNSGGAG